MRVPEHLRDRVEELAARLREGEAVERKLLVTLKRVWHSTDQVPKDVLDDLAAYVEEHLVERLEDLDPEEAEDLAARLKKGETYATLARTLVPLLRRVVGDEEGERPKQLYVRLPRELHDEITALAFARGDSLNSLFVEAVRCFLEANPAPKELVRRGQLAGEPLRCCPEE